MCESIGHCVYCVCVSLLVCMIKVKMLAKPISLCQTYNKFDAFLHKTHSKVYLVLRYQGSTNVGR